jgi:ADP-ribose pyrophosphatase YjhB (NUDIX family)
LTVKAHMALRFLKYWTDLIKPALLGKTIPIIPQAVVLRHEEILLVKRDNPQLWELPGGGVLSGETIEDAVRREVQEEAGIAIEIVEFLGWYERTGFRAHRSPTYVCRSISGNLVSTAEDVIDVRYFPLKDLPKNIFPWFRPLLSNDVNSARSSPLKRTQHLGCSVVLRCIGLDVGGRLGLFD